MSGWIEEEGRAVHGCKFQRSHRVNDASILLPAKEHVIFLTHPLSYSGTYPWVYVLKCQPSCDRAKVVSPTSINSGGTESKNVPHGVTPPENVSKDKILV